MSGSVRSAPFGQLPDGTPVELFTLENSNGLVLRVTNYGTIITELHVPDRHGKFGDVVLGFDNLAQYLGGHPYFGCTVGRVAGRIRGASFELDGVTHGVSPNNGAHHLHGGAVGFDKTVWQASTGKMSSAAVQFCHVSLDGDQGYPGRLAVEVTMSLDDTNRLTIEYAATTDRATLVSLTNHSYFNLATAGEVLAHDVMLAATHYTPTDADLIPTGAIDSVTDTPFDFTTSAAIGARMKQVDGPLPGYDHNFVLPGDGDSPRLVARVMEPESGRVLTMYTSEPSLQFYTGNALDGSLIGKRGLRYGRHTGLCLEAQQFPDAVHHPRFPPNILRPDQRYHQVTQYRFSTA